MKIIYNMSMDTRLFALIAFGVLALFMCFLSAFYTKSEKVKSFIAIKSLSSLSYIVLAVVSTNLVYITYAYALFIVLALAIFMMSNIVRAIPTRSDMFHSFYTFFESLAVCSLIISVIFLFSKPLYGLVIGVSFFLVLLVAYLIKKKTDTKKDKLTNLLLFLASCLYLGISANFAVITFSVVSMLMAVSGLFLFVYVILQNFTLFTNKKAGIVKNIFLGISLIIVSLAIFFI